MGFFDAIAKSVSKGVQNTLENAIKTNWEKMRRLEQGRLVEICNVSENSTVKMLAYILLCQHGDPSYKIDRDNSEEILNRLKRFVKQNMFLLGEGREWEEIREAVKKMKARGYLED